LFEEAIRLSVPTATHSDWVGQETPSMKTFPASPGSWAEFQDDAPALRVKMAGNMSPMTKAAMGSGPNRWRVDRARPPRQGTWSAGDPITWKKYRNASDIYSRRHVRDSPVEGLRQAAVVAPTGGAANTQSKTIVLRLKRKR
jgi:hypothetical protein